jgi:drug/metabolite transporter (DMT)-like permease
MNWGGVLLVIGATFCWSTGGLIVRLVEAPALAIVFWRSIFLMLAVGGVLLIKYRPLGLWRFMLRNGKWGAVSGGLLACSFVGYVIALSETTVANTVLLMSASPIIAALLARWLLKEELSKGAFFAIILAMTGIATMLAMTPFAESLVISGRDLALLALMGSFQLGLGLFLFLRGVARLPAATAGLLTLGEVILAPLWVWLFLNETPSPATLVGGGILLLALAISARFQSSS